jgi:hypothetical protein
MNERIKVLALQARLGPALLLHHWGKIDALTDSEQEGLEQIEKFAELIVKECCEVAHCNFHVDGLTLGGILKEHFGVEE